MSDLIALYRESPLMFIMLVIVCLGVGLGSGYVSNVFGQDVLAKANAYTDERVGEINCTLIRMQKSSANSELFNLEEREKENPTQDRRRRIKQLNDDVSTFTDQLKGCPR